MANVTARFGADFSNFTTAVSAASVKLKDFEQDAKKVQDTVQAIGDRFGGKKIIQDAEMTAKAIEAIGGASKLTAAEQAKVNATVTEAIAKYKALGKEAPQALTDLAAATTKVETATVKANAAASGGVFGELATQVKATALGFVSAQAIIGAVQGSLQALTAFVGNSIASYASAEAAARKMTTALQAQGTATPGVIADFNELAASFQKTTVYSDDLINEMQALLTQVGDVAPGQMGKALTAATDLAAGLGIDLKTATLMVSKASEENVGALKKAGIALDETRVAGEGMSYILGEIEKKFGGQAQADAESYAGKIQQIANAWDNVQEAVGGAIVQHPLVAAGLRAIKDGADAAGDGASTLGKAWNDSISFLVPNWMRELAGLATEIADTNNAMAAAVANLPKAPKMFDAGPSDPFAQFGDIWAKSKQLVDETITGWDKADKAAAKYGDTVAASFKKWSGAGATEQMKVLDTTFRQLAASGELTQDMIDGMVAEAIKLQGEGGKMTQRLWDMVLATDALNPGLAKTAIDIGKIGTQSAIVIPQLDALGLAMQKMASLPKGPGVGAFGVNVGKPNLDAVLDEAARINKLISNQLEDGIKYAFTSGVSGFANDLSGVIAGDASIGKAFGNFGTNVAKDFAATALSFIPGIGPMIAQFAGPMVDGIKKIFGSIFGATDYEKRVREDAKQTAALQAELIKTHGSMDQLIIDADKVGINIKEAFSWHDAAALGVVIDDLDAKTKALSQTNAEASAAHADALDVITAKYKDTLDTLDSEWKSLNESVSREAEEAVMGTVEVQERARMAEIDAEREALQQQQANELAANAETFDAMLTAGRDVDAELRKLFGKPLEIPYSFAPTGAPPPGAPPLPTTEPILPPGVAVAPAARPAGGGTAILQLDGRTLAEVVVPAIPGVVTRYGLDRG